MLKKITAITLTLLMLCSTVVFAANEYDYITMLQELNAIDYNSTFTMDSILTRAQFSKMAIMISPYRDYVASNLSISPFIDVTHKHWSAPYVYTAVSNGIINGYVDGTFKPENPINYEEALTICLRILGYTNNDFGAAWPNGQIATAKQIGLTDNLVCSKGINIHRADTVNLLYNTLCTPKKGSTTPYAETLGYKITDSVDIIASNSQDSTVPKDSIKTSVGVFKIDSYFNYNNIGLKGTIVTKGNDFILFFPDEDVKTFEEYIVYAPLAGDVLVYKNDSIENLAAPLDTTVYMSGQQTTLGNVLSSLDIGYSLNISRNTDGSIDYITIESNTLDGPVIVNQNTINNYRYAANIIKDGKKSSLSELADNDVLYYLAALNTIWAYSKKITGIYESAMPNKDTPTSITVSGKTYTLEGAAAYSALASTGNIEYGDTITLLIGRKGDVAGVISASSAVLQSQTAGYLIDAGQKQFTDSKGNEYTSLYVTIVQPDGKTYEYTTDSNYNSHFSSLLNSVVTVTFTDGKVSLRPIANSAKISGKVSYSNMTLGNYKLAKDVEILDISTTTPSDTPLYISTFVQRLDGMNIPASSILYCDLNKSGEIQKLILKNVTGDMYSYGIVTKADVSAMGYSANYSYIIDGKASQITSSSVYSVSSGEPSKFVINNGRVTSIEPIKPISGKISSVSSADLKADGKTYLLSDKVTVYERTFASGYTYLKTPLEDLIKNQDDYTIKAYTDKELSAKCRVRIIIIEKNKYIHGENIMNSETAVTFRYTNNPKIPAEVTANGYTTPV